MKSMYARFVFVCAMVNLYAAPRPPRLPRPSRPVRPAPQRIVVLSVPKSGTHLVGKAVELMTGKKIAYNPKGINWNTHFYMAHETRLIPRKLDVTYLVIFRDPRDQFVSYIRFLEKKNFRVDKSVPMDTIVRELLLHFDAALQKHYKNPYTAEKKIKTLAQFYGRFLGFARLAKAYVTRFEKLVGQQGGGSRELQFHELRHIAAHLNLTLSDEELNAVADKLFGDTNTFAQGQIGGWKAFLSLENRKLFQVSIGDILSTLGYTTDDSWIWA